MAIEIKVPVLPESVSDATVASWHKQAGQFVARDENLVDIETDKVVLEVVAPQDGILSEIKHPQGALVRAEEVIGLFVPGAQDASNSKSAPIPAPSEASPVIAEAQVANPSSPVVRRLLNEHDIDPSAVNGSGKGGRITKEDVLSHINRLQAPASAAAEPSPSSIVTPPSGTRSEQRVPMSRLRARVAERLVQAQHTAAILTTFNEVNMQPVMDLRNKYKELFEKRHNVRLGFMSFFIMSVVEALKRFPAVNASIDGGDLIYHGFFDIGIAVASPRGLVVPIIRDADKLAAFELEKQISDFGKRAQEGQLSVNDMTGGTFTISNGGVFGSLLSTPILNPPQSAILGMHKIEERPIVEKGAVVIRPMMYLALSYDHRIIDGSESVRFLVTVKEMLEDPARLMLGV